MPLQRPIRMPARCPMAAWYGVPRTRDRQRRRSASASAVGVARAQVRPDKSCIAMACRAKVSPAKVSRTRVSWSRAFRTGGFRLRALLRMAEPFRQPLPRVARSKAHRLRKAGRLRPLVSVARTGVHPGSVGGASGAGSSAGHSASALAGRAKGGGDRGREANDGARTDGTPAGAEMRRAGDRGAALSGGDRAGAERQAAPSGHKQSKANRGERQGNRHGGKSGRGQRALQGRPLTPERAQERAPLRDGVQAARAAERPQDGQAAAPASGRSIGPPHRQDRTGPAITGHPAIPTARAAGRTPRRHQARRMVAAARTGTTGRPGAAAQRHIRSAHGTGPRPR